MNSGDLIIPDMIVMDGFEDCILGVCERYGQEQVVAYDLDKILVKLMSGGMTFEEAYEFFYFNQIGSYVGEKTPCFVTIADNKQQLSNGEKLNER